MTKTYRIWFLLIALAISVFSLVSSKEKIKPNIKYKVLVEGLNHPWSVIWLTNKRLLITERNGSLVLFENNKKNILKLPVNNIYAFGQGGLLDLAKHPQYKTNGWIYLTYSGFDKKKNYLTTTYLSRFQLQNKKIKNWQVLYYAKPYQRTSHHFGGRIVFDKKGFLYLTVGDRGQRHLAQNTKNDLGKILRLNDKGEIPKDNPFKNAVFSYGHRNPQGFIYLNNQLIAHEHGPKGGDELNIIKRGKNYGWPIITYGKEYLTGRSIGEGTQKKGIIQPLHYWVPSIAPSGMAFYAAKNIKGFTSWKNNLLVGSLKFQQLVLLDFNFDFTLNEKNKIKKYGKNKIKEKRILTGVFGRIRDVRVHNKQIYLLIDSSDGKLIQLIP